MNSLRVRLALSLLLALLAGTRMLRAQEWEEAWEEDDAPPTAVLADPDEAVKSAREALSKGNRLPWYDAENDDVRALRLPPAKDGQLDNRKSRWEAEPANPKQTQQNAPTWQGPSPGFWTALRILFWTIALAILAFIVYLLVRAYLKRENAVVMASREFALDEAVDDAERIESLPFTVARPRGDLLDEALAQYNAGNYRQAVIYLFSYLLIQLDKHHRIHLARGKTNRMYLRELRTHPELRNILERTMLAFEHVFFGNHPLSREDFESCWNQLDEFHRHLDQQVAV